MLLVGGEFAQIVPYIDPATPREALERALASWPGPQTWVFPRAPGVPEWIAGDHPGIALRVTAHPTAAALCAAFGGALVSTSANRHGEAPARCAEAVRLAFGYDIDALVDGALGGLERPTPIRDAISGALLRR